MNLDDLAAEWKEIDMRTLSMAVETGKLAERGRWSMWMIWGVTAYMTLFSLLALVGVVAQPSPGSVGVLLLMLVFTVPMFVFERRQRHDQRAAEGLLHGPPADVVRGRIRMLGMEIRAWRGPIALGMAFAGYALCLGSIAVMAPQGAPVLWPIAFLVGLMVFTGYGWLRRLPRLRAEIAELEGLEQELRDA